jgi:hypothetical protein
MWRDGCRCSRRGRQVVLLAAAACAVGLMAPTTGDAHVPLVSGKTGSVVTVRALVRRTDVTATQLGRTVASVASRRFAADGLSVLPRDLRVLRDRDGLLVTTRTTSVAMRDGVATPVARPAAAAHLRASLAGTPTWSPAGNNCYARISDGWSWLDHCTRIYRLLSDGDSQRDFYILEHLGTAGPNNPWVLKDAGLADLPAETSTSMTWVDWAPRSDRTGPCQSFTLRTTSPVAGPAEIVERCESWDATKGAAGGTLALHWSGCACAQDRELGTVVAVSVPQGGTPIWYVPADVSGFAF